MDRIKNSRRLSILLVLILDFSIVICATVLKKALPFLMGLLPDCVFAKYGLPCPSCGGTRCVYSLVCGKIPEAFFYNQFFFTASIYAFFAFILINIAVLFKSQFAEKLVKAMISYKALIAFAVLYAAFAFFRIFS
ncbi:MAG: DUF2752 domain-containing protein [Candidatus Fimenecus sp.]